MKEYKTTIWPFGIVCVVAVGGMALIVFPGTGKFWKDLEVFVVCVAAPILGSLVLFGWFTYVRIYDATVKHVQLAVYRRAVPIANITKVSQEGTYYAASSVIKSLYVYYIQQNGRERFLHLSMALYSEETLGRLLRDLKDINPKIKLDDYCEKLIRKGDSSKLAA
jgi:hypothetical protein